MLVCLSCKQDMEDIITGAGAINLHVKPAKKETFLERSRHEFVASIDFSRRKDLITVQP